MKALFILLKANFINTYGINKILKNKKSAILGGLVFAAIFAYFIGISAFYAMMVADSLEKFNLMSFMLTMFFIMATFATFMFSVYSAKASLFNANDNDMLLSMPIKPSTILASRLINLTATNLLASLILMGPAFAVYATRVDVNALYYVNAVIIFLLLPIIPTILACLIGYFIAYFTSKSNSKNWLEMIMSFVFILFIFLITSFGDKILTYVVKDMSTIENILKWGFYPIYLVNEIFSTNNYSSMIIFIIINIAVLVIFINVLSKSFKSIIVKLQENKTKSNFKIKTLKTASVGKALFMKDLKRFISSPIYVLNTSFGIIMLLIMSVASIFYDKSKILELLNMSDANVTSFMMVTLIVVFVVFMSNTAAASISIEGKNFWIVKSLPVDPKKVLNSKLYLNLFMVLPVVFLSIIIFKFTFVLTLSEVLILFIISILAALLIYQFGLLINLKFPKMDAVSDTVVVKQSLSVMISIMIPLVLFFIATGVYGELSKSINFNLFILIVMCFFAILIIIEKIVLNTWGIKRFKKIN